MHLLTDAFPPELVNLRTGLDTIFPFQCGLSLQYVKWELFLLACFNEGGIKVHTE